LRYSAASLLLLLPPPPPPPLLLLLLCASTLLASLEIRDGVEVCGALREQRLVQSW
jgi:hypothetical protein